MELLPFVDVLKVFNNPINEEQAWAVCHQCANFLFTNPNQEFYQVLLDSGINSIWLSRHGDVLLKKGPSDPNGSGKGPPSNSESHIPPPHSPQSILPRKKSRHVIATETDAVQSLGTVIFQTLDYGLEASEERQLSSGLENLIATMTNADFSLDYDPEASCVDDEGIEDDADLQAIDQHRCTVHDVLKLCSQHLPSKQDASHHYKAVCRALATEAGELFTFLDKISAGKEKLSETSSEDDKRLEELQRADWACMWVQVMRSLRAGVRLKKVEHIAHPPLEYELTPFEMILDDIKSRRYHLTKIMKNGEIPKKVKSDAHAVILDFIRSRPPLKKVDDRQLKPKPPSPPDPHQSLLIDIRACPKLKPVRGGKLVVSQPSSVLSSQPTTGLLDSPPDSPTDSQPAVKRVIKPDFNLLLNNSFEDSSEDDPSDMSHQGSPLSHSSPIHSYRDRDTGHTSWQRAVTRDNLLQDSTSSGRSTRLQRRHTIMICESPLDGAGGQGGNTKVELPVLEEEEDEPSPVRESHCLASHAHHTAHAEPQQHQLLAHRRSHLTRAASDNDLLAHVTLRQHHPQGQGGGGGGGRRSSLEHHRRSLTSLSQTALCAIPEMEDSSLERSGEGGSLSPGSATPQRSASSASASGHIRRWSHEHAPPPNPSPPCKGRRLAGLTGPGASQYHPLSRSQSARSSSAMAAASNNKLSGMSSPSMSSSTPVAVPPSKNVSSSSMRMPPPSSSTTQHSWHGLSPQASPRALSSSSSSSSISSSTSSSPLSSPRKHVTSTTNTTTLDPSTSSQSPIFFKKTRALHRQRDSPSASSSADEGSAAEGKDGGVSRMARWRLPQAREERLSRQRPTPMRDNRATPEDFNSVLPDTPTGMDRFEEDNHTVSEASRRLSLDNGVRRYTTGPSNSSRVAATTSSSHAEDVDTIKAKRRLSLGVKERKPFGTPRSPEEEDRVTRWRTLQAEHMEARTSTSTSSAAAAAGSPKTFRDSAQSQAQSGGGQTVSKASGLMRIRESTEPQQHQQQQQQQGSPTAESQPPQTWTKLRKAMSMPSSKMAAAARTAAGGESADVQQQPQHKGLGSLPVSAKEQEDRFARWRMLEESPGMDIVDSSSSTDNVFPDSPADRFARDDLPTSRSQSLRSQRSASYSSPRDSRSLPSTQHHEPGSLMPLSKRWQNPVECLSLTLEEVTHIRSVLTKAELESLLSHPDLHRQVSKNKLCFTCKTVRFSLFGEWGTKCKFCKRTVCSKCLRKMNVPSDQFSNIPVYTLSPMPLTPEMQEFIQTFVKKAPASPVPAASSTREARDSSPSPSSTPRSSRQSAPSNNNTTSASDKTTSTTTTTSSSNSKLGKLGRSQSVVIPGRASTGGLMTGLSRSASIKGPVMAICCDCRGMVMEIIRASRASLAMLSGSSSQSSIGGRSSGGLPSLSSSASININASKQSLF